MKEKLRLRSTNSLQQSKKTSVWRKISSGVMCSSHKLLLWLIIYNAGEQSFRYTPKHIQAFQRSVTGTELWIPSPPATFITPSGKPVITLKKTLKRTSLMLLNPQRPFYCIFIQQPTRDIRKTFYHLKDVLSVWWSSKFIYIFPIRNSLQSYFPHHFAHQEFVLHY